MKKRPKSDSPEVTLFIRYIPQQVRDHFKAWCYKRGTTMSAEIIKLMKDRVQEVSKQ